MDTYFKNELPLFVGKTPPTILVTSGLIDLKEAVNQVIKNTLIGYAKRGFNVLVLTAIPSGILKG